MNQYVPSLAYFLARIEKLADGCWRWLGYLNADGYAQASKGSAYALSFRLAGKNIPDGMELDHLCRNRWCVNPDHLEPVTHSENVARGAWATKRSCPIGHRYDQSNTRRRIKSGRRTFCRDCRACQTLKNRYLGLQRAIVRYQKQMMRARSGSAQAALL